jgi:hypothetical protein
VTVTVTAERTITVAASTVYATVTVTEAAGALPVAQGSGES